MLYLKPFFLQLFLQWTWGRISVTYVIYRLLVAILVIAWAFGDFFDEAGRWYSFNYAIWLVFATNWSLFCLSVNCVVMAITTTYYYVRAKCAVYDDKGEPTSACKVYDEVNMVF